jgi:hypothetical protein
MSLHEVWAITASGDEPQRRWFGGREESVAEANWIARQGFPAGAVSVWVVDPTGDVIWAAGQKAQELIERGAKLDAELFVVAPPERAS